MIHKNLTFISVLCCLLSTSVSAIRHSRIKKTERFEKAKKVVITGDQRLSQALSKQIKYMQFEDAVLAKDHYVKTKDLDAAIKCAKQALAKGGDEEVVRKVRFELAEIYLEKRKLKEAQECAMEYQKFYPGATETIKAEYIIIRASFLGQSQSDRDQENTHTTIDRAHAFLDKHAQNEYSQSVMEMLDLSYQTVIRSELNVIDTQLNAYNYTKTQAFLDAALKRITFIKEKYLPHAPSTAKKIHEVEIHLAKISGKQSASENKTVSAKEDKLIIAQARKQPRKSFVRVIKNAFVENNDEYFA